MFQADTRKIFIPVLIVVYALVIFRAANVTFENMGRSRTQIRGDSLSESLTWNGARYFFDHGFWATKFMPNYFYTGELAEKKIKEFKVEAIYTHFPSLPDVITGVTAVILGTTDVRFLRILPVLLSPLLILLIWKCLNLLLDRREAIISTIALVTANYFVAWADNIHKFQYEELVKWAILFIFLRRFRQQPTNYDIPLLGLLYFLAAAISFDAILVSAVICIGFSWIYRRRIFTLETVVPGAMTVLCLMLHFGQNVLFFGSVDAAWKDITGIFFHRTIGLGPSETGPITLLTWLQHMFYWNINRVERYFLIPGWMIIIYAVILYRRWRGAADKTSAILVLFAIASVIWNCFMWQHAIVHVSTARNWAMISGLLSGPILVLMWNQFRNWRNIHNGWRVFLVISTIYFSGMVLTQHIWSIYLQFGFLFRKYGQ